MQSKLQELTDKLYNDGVSKAKDEADSIISEAKSKAETIVNEAREQADQIITDAKKSADEQKTNADSEIKLSAEQAISALKQKITSLVSSAAIDPDTKEAMNDKEFVKKLLETAISNWKSDTEKIELNVLLPEKDQKELEKFYSGKAAGVLAKGVEVNFDDTLEGGFKIGPKDGSFQISFAEKDFGNFFKSYLKPKTAQLLYGGN